MLQHTHVYVLTFGRKPVLLPALTLPSQAVIALKSTLVDLVHVEHTDSVHTAATMDASHHRLLVNGVVLHLLEEGLWNDSGCEGIISYCHLVSCDLTETLGTVHIPNREKRYI